MVEDGQNRCRRCDRPLSDPTANYGSWCAKIVGANKYNEIASMLDENAMEMYNRYMVDYLYTDVIVLNNRQGASTAGHNAIMLLNPSGQGFYFSYSAANGYPDDIGEMRFSILNADEVNEVKDRSGIMNESVTIYGDRRWEKDKDAYDRFVWCDLPNMEAGKRMFQYAADIFSNPGHYNVILYKGGQQCDYMVQQILAAGGIEYEKKVFPNNSFELFRTGKTHWEN